MARSDLERIEDTIGDVLFIALSVYMWKHSIVARIMMILFGLWAAAFIVYFVVAFITL